MNRRTGLLSLLFSLFEIQQKPTIHHELQNSRFLSAGFYGKLDYLVNRPASAWMENKTETPGPSKYKQYSSKC